MTAAVLSIDDPAVVEFLHDHLVPTDIRWDYRIDDALPYILGELENGNQFLIGDMARGVVFRCYVRNPRVIEPHVMGNALHIRSVFRDCLPLVWAMGVTKIMVWTQYPALGAIVQRLGFVQEGCFVRSHMVEDTMLDMSVYSLERPE